MLSPVIGPLQAPREYLGNCMHYQETWHTTLHLHALLALHLHHLHHLLLLHRHHAKERHTRAREIEKT